MVWCFGASVLWATVLDGEAAFPAESAAGREAFSYTLKREMSTSAAIYGEDGVLVRVLWTQQLAKAGKHTVRWDGKNDFGETVPPGNYRYRVAACGSTYTNVGAIGNSARQPIAADSAPTTMRSVAVDPQGNIVTANDWNEPGADFKKWDSSGKDVFHAEYQIRNGQPNGAAYAIAADEQTIYCAVRGWDKEPFNDKQVIERFSARDGKRQPFTMVGKDGNIEILEWPAKKIPPNTPPEDAELMRQPLRAMAVAGPLLLVVDALSGKVRRFDKVTGKPQGDFDVPLPVAIAVGRAGQIWVGHQHQRVSVFSPEGKQLGQPIDDLQDVASLSFDAGGRLYVADRGAGQIKIYKVVETKATLDKTFGQKAVPGDRAADRFFKLDGAAVDRHGNLVTIQNEPVNGARLASWSPLEQLRWEHFGCEFVSLGNYSPSDPDTFYSMSFHRYRLGDHNAGKWTYEGCMIDQRPVYHTDVHGVPRLLRLNDHDFWFMPTGDGVQVYRIENGAARLASVLGGGSPNADGKMMAWDEAGQWSWSDAKGDGRVDPEDIQWLKMPEKSSRDSQVVSCANVDLNGNIWIVERRSCTIRTVPLAGFDPQGNPKYDSPRTRVVVPKDETALGFVPWTVQHADDDSIYAIGFSKIWPAPKVNPFWMGGSTLVRFDAQGRRLWAVHLPESCVGLDFIPGGKGGCVVGEGCKALLHHYSADGLLLGTIGPGKAMGKTSGWFDNNASVAVQRDPRDGILDVFVEDDGVLRIGWYRINDHSIHTTSGEFTW